MKKLADIFTASKAQAAIDWVSIFSPKPSLQRPHRIGPGTVHPSTGKPNGEGMLASQVQALSLMSWMDIRQFMAAHS